MAADPPSFLDFRHGTESATRLFALGFRTAGTDIENDPNDLGQAHEMIGRYELITPLGEGGFGIVWHAHQHVPIEREVALKVIKAGLDNRDIIARFEAERQALARMDHPNIAAVLDAGTTANGRPYFVMELVHGMPITDYCDQQRLTVPDRLALFITVCQAVQHAHQKAILHRDLKPSNILVTEVDGKPVAKVIDFGIAKALGTGEEVLDAERRGQTAIGTVIGTPQYMSPEQAGGGLDVDTRSDVYALGIILCELLTGRTQLPPQLPDFAATLRHISEAEPVRPSALVQSLDADLAESAKKRRIEPARYARILRGDLDWITLKALEKDRARRYETPTALARDLRRYLDQETVSAAAPTWHYQLGKFARRHRTALVAAVLIAAALISGTGVSLWQAARAERSRAEAEANFAQAREAVDQYLSRVTVQPRLAEADFHDLQISLLETALPFYEKISRTHGDDPKLRADRAWALGRLALIYQRTGQWNQALAASDQAMDLGKKLVAQFPDNPSYQKMLGLWNADFAYGQFKHGSPEESLIGYARAIDCFNPLVTRYPEPEEYSLALGNVLVNRGTALIMLKRVDEAETDITKATAILEKLADRFPQNPTFRQQLGAGFTALGLIQRARKQRSEAESSLHHAVELQEGTAKENPSAEYRRTLVVSLINLGAELCHNDKSTEGQACFQRALSIGQKLVDDFPTITLYREGLMQAHFAISEDLALHGMAAESNASLERGRIEQKKLAAAFPLSNAFHQEPETSQASIPQEPRKNSPGPTAADAHTPHLFVLDYNGKVDPGQRHWARQGTTWTEIQPSGLKNVFNVVGPATVDNIRGTEIKRVSGDARPLFIPDLDTTPPLRLRLKSKEGRWYWIGEIRDME